MKQSFEKDLFERTSAPRNTLSPKAKASLLSAQDLTLQPSLSAQHNASPKSPQAVRNLDLRTTISHDINAQSPPSKDKGFSQRDILLKIPVDLYNKDQIWDAVHIFQSPRDKLKMIDLVLERRNQINERKKRKKFAKAMTLLPEVTGSLDDNKYVEPEPLHVINRFRRTMCELDEQPDQVLPEEHGIQPAQKGNKKKLRGANTQTALENYDGSDSDSSDSSTESVKLVFPMDETDSRAKILRRKGSVLQVRMSGGTLMNGFKFGELNPIAETITPRKSIHDLNAERKKSIKPKEDQAGNPQQQATPEIPHLMRRKSSFNQVIKPKEDVGNGPEIPYVMKRKSSFNQVIKSKEDFAVSGQSGEISPILKRKSSFNQPVIKPKEEIVNPIPEMPAILRRKNSVGLALKQKDETGVAIQNNNNNNESSSPPVLRRKSSVNLTLEALVTTKAGSPEQNKTHISPIPNPKKEENSSSPLIYHPKKGVNKSVTVLTTDTVKIQKSEPNDAVYSIAGKKFEKDLSKFLLKNKDHSVSQLILKQSSTMSPKMKQIQHHVKSHFQEATGIKPEKKLPSLSLTKANIKVMDKSAGNSKDLSMGTGTGGLNSPKKLSQLLTRTSVDFNKEMRKNRSIRQKSVSLIRAPDQELPELETEETPVQTKRVLVKKTNLFQEIISARGEKKVFEKSPRVAKTVRGLGSVDYAFENLKKTTWKDEFKRSMKVSS